MVGDYFLSINQSINQSMIGIFSGQAVIMEEKYLINDLMSSYNSDARPVKNSSETLYVNVSVVMSQIDSLVGGRNCSIT
jgi:hypothetical protein